MNQHRNISAGYIAVLLFCYTATHAQATASKLEDQFNTYNERVMQEKLYLHVDRNFYLAGDILWFKAYLVDAVMHRPLDLSKVVYAEVLDENNTPVLQAKIGMDKGKGNGSLSIPVTIKSGNYKLRAYTNWMKNQGPDYFFEKNITVVNAQRNRELTDATAKKNTEPDIRFFPEGGNLVTGITSRLACKVTGTNGSGLNFAGRIVDENNTAVADFNALKFGMGSFMFTPQPGHRYKAVIEANGSSYTRSIPDVFEKGYVMQLNTSDKNTLSISVQSNAADTGKLFLLVHTRQSLKIVLQASMEKGRAVFAVDAAKPDDGISQFTVFNSAGRPLCERLYFTYPKQSLSIAVSGNQENYATRSKIDLQLKAAEKNTPVSADMSVAVYRIDDLQETDESSIQSWLLLNSDLKGYIESPGYYFNDPSSAAAMDNLMLTQGWRRFRWDDVVSYKTPPVLFVPEHSGHIVTGKVTSSVTGQPLEDIETYASAPGFNGNLRVYISDSSGKVKFDFKNMEGSSELIIQTNPAADSTARVEINNPFSEQYSGTRLPAFRLLSAKENMLRDQSIAIQTQNMYARPKLKRFLQAQDTVASFDRPTATYFLDNYTRFTTTEEVLREYVELIDVFKTRGKFGIHVFDNHIVPNLDMANKSFFQGEPLILVDGVPVFSTDRLMSFDPLKLRKLEVFHHRVYMGNSFFSGILNWTTYKGDYANFELDPHALVIDYEGLQLEREFYSPVYDGKTDMSHIPDYRTLLYWSHDIATEANGEQHIRFYTSDKKGKYIAVIQGLNEDGRCGSTVSKFEVK